jgi:CHAT domain-containing protein/tetratricopeptide (TPR) repeat protein
MRKQTHSSGNPTLSERGRRAAARVRRGLWLGLMVNGLLACAPAADETVVLLERSGRIGPDATVTVHWVADADMHLLVRLDQLAADLRLHVVATGETGSINRPVDNGLFRDGSEWAALEISAGAPIEVVISAGEDVAADAGYTLTLSSMPPDGEANRARIVGMEAMTIAGEGLAEGSGASRTEAESALVMAVEVFDVVGLEQERASASYALAMLRYAWFYRWNESAMQFGTAARRFDALGDIHLAAQSRLWQGAALAETSDLVRARELVERAHAELTDIGAAYDAAFAMNMRAYVATKQGRYGDSIEGYRIARDAFAAMGERLREAQAQSNLAVDAVRAGRLHDAVVEIERSVRNLEGSSELRRLAETLLNLAWVQNRTGELGGARSTYLRALETFRSIDDRSGELYATNGLAWTYAQTGDSATAADLFDQVAAGASEQDDRDLELESLAFAGGLLRQQGALAPAVDRHTRMLQRSRTDLERSRALLQLGLDEAARTDVAAALGYFERAERQLDSVTLAPELALRLDLSIGATLMQGAAEGRADDLQRAEERMSRVAASAPALGMSGLRVEALQALARLAARAGDHVSARRYSSGALEGIRDLRAQIPGGHLRWTHSGAQRPRFVEQVDLLMDLARPADPQTRRQLEIEALEVSEEAHALALAEFIEGGSGPGGAAAVVRAQLAALRIQFDRTAADAASERSRLEAEIRAASIELDRSWETADWPIRRTGVGVDEIRTLLEAQGVPTAALVEFLLGDQQSYAWVVTRDEVRAIPLAARADIERAALAAYQSLSRQRVGVADTTATDLAELGRLVIDPIFTESTPELLIIVADGALNLVPFDAIAHPAGGALIDHSEVVHAPSATVLALLDNSRRSSAAATTERAAVPGVDLDLVAFADPVGSTEDPRIEDLSRLPGAVDEVTQVAAAVRAAGLSARVLIGVDADLQALETIGQTARILHLATHGVLDLERPWASGLLLVDAGVKRLISPTDLLSLDLSAELVVLSACDTSHGTLNDVEGAGQGAMSLAQSFIAAGAPRVVSTLWQVDDASAGLLMDAFYRGLLAGQRPSAALRSAKLALRASGGRGSEPGQWAAFEFIGLPTAMGPF